MTKRMLIDATHAEETRVVVLDGNRLEDFDVETSTKKQLKGNIYLAKVVRVEPSLQAAFVEYGGGRHGFLAFGEIHPDYYQIPVADRQRLLAMQAEEAREEAEAEDAAAAAEARHGGHHHQTHHAASAPPPVDDQPPEPVEAEPAEAFAAAPDASEASHEPEPPEPEAAAPEAPADDDHDHRPAQAAMMPRDERYGAADGDVLAPPPPEDDDIDVIDPDGPQPELIPPETIGGDSEASDGAEEARARRASRFLRNYRIQEVIKRRQILLIQVVKEERGTKGAALTTYISLAGRFCVLMPNSPRGGGISRKITSAADRRRLKEITSELEIPNGMGLIVRTAGANRPKPEIKRDCEYLMRLWDDIREHTMRSIAPSLIYEEASLIKRAIRDVYSRDVDEVVVDGVEGWKAAHDFMRMLMPSHAKKVILWNGHGGGVSQPLFAKHQVEAQLDAMLSPTVQLKSGGYLVINQTEALVAIDVNSGRSTRERGIEETALRTNLEAADEVARQLRLRDLAGLIVIDFIDMEAKKHNGMVEKRIKDALKIDRARIQVGHISHFGLLEMSRQRLRPSLAETSFVACPHCGGLGHVRSTESSAIHVLRAIEEEGAKFRAALIMVHVASAVALYLLNNKRERLAEIEARYAMKVHFTPDDTLIAPDSRIDRLKPQVPENERPRLAAPVAVAAPAPPSAADDDEVEADDVFDPDEELPVAAAPVARAPAAPVAEPRPPAEDGVRRRRRRRRRGARRDQNGVEIPGSAPEAGSPGEYEDDGPEETDPSLPIAAPADIEAELEAEVEAPSDLRGSEQPSLDAADLDENGLPKPRRRGRRGGRRRRRGETDIAEPAAETPEAPAYTAPAYVPAYTGPTPADPFGGGPFDIFDMIDQEADDQPAYAPKAATPAAMAAIHQPALPAQPADPEPAPAMEETATVVTQAMQFDDVAEPAPIPAAAASEDEVQAPDPEPIVSVAAAPAEPVAGPAIKPVVIGRDELPAAEPKRGWWKR